MTDVRDMEIDDIVREILAGKTKDIWRQDDLRVWLTVKCKRAQGIGITSEMVDPGGRAIEFSDGTKVRAAS